MKILLVDDLQEIREILNEVLTSFGHKVQMFESAIHALRAIEDFTSFDLIISDFQMPKMNGIEFLEKLVSSKQLPPFVLFTSTLLEIKESDLLRVKASFQKYELNELVEFVNQYRPDNFNQTG